MDSLLLYTPGRFQLNSFKPPVLFQYQTINWQSKWFWLCRILKSQTEYSDFGESHLGSSGLLTNTAFWNWHFSTFFSFMPKIIFTKTNAILNIAFITRTENKNIYKDTLSSQFWEVLNYSFTHSVKIKNCTPKFYFAQMFANRLYSCIMRWWSFGVILNISLYTFILLNNYKNDLNSVCQPHWKLKFPQYTHNPQVEKVMFMQSFTEMCCI